MTDDLRRLALAYLLVKGGATQGELRAFVEQRSHATGAYAYMVRELIARGYVEQDSELRLRVTSAFEHFKTDFGISLTTPTGGRPGLHVHPIFYTRVRRPRARNCFVIMPFSSKFDVVYTTGIRPAVEDSKHRCRRADEIYSAGPVMERVWHYLVESWIVIADLTSRNANVLYELGIAHTLGREVILLAQQGEDIPFDLRTHRRLLYDTDGAGLDQLREDLTAAIRNLAAGLR